MLTERTEHLDAIKLTLDGLELAPFVLQGRMSRKALVADLDALPPDVRIIDFVDTGHPAAELTRSRGQSAPWRSAIFSTRSPSVLYISRSGLPMLIPIVSSPRIPER